MQMALKMSMGGTSGGGRAPAASIPSFVTSPANLSYAVIGDSRANADLGNTNTATVKNWKNKNLGGRHFAAQTMNQRFIRSVNDYGVGGATIDDIVYGRNGHVGVAAAFAADPSTTWRFVGGVNTWTSTTDDAASRLAALQKAIADIEYVAQLAYQNQRRIIIGEYPASVAAASMSAGRQQLMSDFDDYLKNINSLYPWMFYAGSFRPLCKAVTGPGDPIDNASYDGKHLMTYGSGIAANAERAILTQLFPNGASQFPLYVGGEANDASNSLVTNHMLTGTAGSAPTGWTLSTLTGITASWAYGTNSRNFNEAILTLTGTPASSGFIHLNQTVTAGLLTTGDILQLGINIDIDDGHTGLSAVSADFTYTDGTNSGDVCDLDSSGATLGGINNTLNGLTGLRGPQLTPKSSALPADGASLTTRSCRPCKIYFINGVPVSATIRLSQVTFKKVAA